MTKPGPAELKWPQFEPQVILMAVGWYLRFSLSYRDVARSREHSTGPIASRLHDRRIVLAPDVDSGGGRRHHFPSCSNS